MESYASRANKAQPPGSIAHMKALILIQRHAKKTSGGIYSFAECRKVLAWLFHLDADEVFAFLGEMEKENLVKIIPFHGIRIDGERGKK